MTKFLMIFIVLSVINVVFSTIKSILTVKGGKFLASLTSGLYYAYYNIVLIFTVQDFPMWQKCVITFACNLVGVFAVKWAEEKAQKDKLWKIECTLPNDEKAEMFFYSLEKMDIPYSYVDIKKYYLINSYCATQEQSKIVKDILKDYKVKYFVVESKNL